MATITTISASDQKGIEDRELEIFSHPAWHGDLSGIECEDILRGFSPGSYLLRGGEKQFQYYLSFVTENYFSFKHQPFLIIPDKSQTIWGYRNGIFHWASTLEDLIPLILHCPLEACYPILRKRHGS